MCKFSARVLVIVLWCPPFDFCLTFAFRYHINRRRTRGGDLGAECVEFLAHRLSSATCNDASGIQSTYLIQQLVALSLQLVAVGCEVCQPGWMVIPS